MWPKPHFILQLFWSLHTYQGCALDGCKTPGQESYSGKTLNNQNMFLPTPILSRCGQRRSLLREQGGLQVENKFRVTSIIIEHIWSSFNAMSIIIYTLDQGSQQWLAAVQNHLLVSSCTRSSNQSRACRPPSPSTANRKPTTVQPSSPLQLLSSPLQVPPSWKGPTLPKSTTLHSLEVATRFPLKYSFSKID